MMKELLVTFTAGQRTVDELRRFLDGLFEQETPSEPSAEIGHVIVRIAHDLWEITEVEALRVTLRYAGFSGEFEVLSEVRSRR